MAVQPGLFDLGERLRRPSDIGDQLEGYAAAVDFERFRPDLEVVLAKSDGAGVAVCLPYDPMPMSKILVNQAQQGLSDDRAMSLINNRLSFMRGFSVWVLATGCRTRRRSGSSGSV